MLEIDEVLDAQIDELSTRLLHSAKHTAVPREPSKNQELQEKLLALWEQRTGLPPKRRSLPVISAPQVKIASPCSVPWEAMSGDRRVRHCKACQKNVYNVSGMPEETATAFLSLYSDVCLRFYRRGDGTLLYGDCPKGERIARLEALAKRAGILIPLLAFIALTFLRNFHSMKPTAGLGESTTRVQSLSQVSNGE